MQVKTFTKRDIAKIVSRNLNKSIRKSIIYTDEVFNAVRELLCKDDDFIRVEVRNFGVIESKPAKAKPKAKKSFNTKSKYLFISVMTWIESGAEDIKKLRMMGLTMK